MSRPSPEDTSRLQKLLLRLAVPAMLHGLVVTVVFFTDRLILGQYSDTAIGSMGISGPVLWSVFSVFGAFTPGIVATVGRAVGAERFDDAAAIARGCMAFAALTGAIVGFVGFISSPVIAGAIVGDDPSDLEVARQAATYMRIVFAVGPLVLLSAACATTLQASGDTRTPMVAGIVGGSLNLAASWLLVFGHGPFPEWGVAGAGLGSAAAFTSECLILFTVLVRGTREIPLHIPIIWSRTRAGVLSALKVARQSYAERAIFHSGFIAYTFIVGHLGAQAMAAHQAVLAVESISFIAAEAFGVAAGALVAQQLGARRPDLAWLGSTLSVRWATGLLLIVAVVFVAIPATLVSPFLQTDAAVALAVPCVLAAAIAQPIMAFCDAIAGILRGAGDTRTPMINAIIGPVFVRLTASYLLAYTFGLGLLGVWLGSTIDWLVRAVWLGIAWWRRKWLETVVETGG